VRKVEDQSNVEEKTLLLEEDSDDIRGLEWDISNEFERRQIIKGLGLENISIIDTSQVTKCKEAETKFREVLAESKNFLMNQSKIPINKNTSKKSMLISTRNNRANTSREVENIGLCYKEFKPKRVSMLRIAMNTCLRYIELKEVLSSLVKSANNSIITKEKFITVVLKLVKTKGFNISKAKQKESLELLFKKLKGKELKELAGGLAIICKGSEKIRTALSFINPKETYLSYKTIYTLLLPIYRLLEEQVPYSIKKITPEDLSRTTALQFIEQYNQDLTIIGFAKWFSSQPKTLTPCYKQPSHHKNSPEEIEIEIHIEPIKPSPEQSLNLSKTSSEEPNNSFNFSHMNPLDTKRQWDSFLTDYYNTYGFYPPPPPLYNNTSRNESNKLKNKPYINQCKSQKGKITKTYCPLLN